MKFASATYLKIMRIKAKKTASVCIFSNDWTDINLVL